MACFSNLKSYCAPLCIQLKSCTVRYVDFDWQTNYMEQSPWKCGSSSPGQEIPQMLWNPKVHYRIHSSPILGPILSQINPGQAILPTFFQMQLKVIFPCMSRSRKQSLPSRFLTKTLDVFSYHHAHHMPRPSNPPLFDHPNRVWWGVRTT